MELPTSLYEAVLQGFAGTGDIRDRRALFLFVVDHSQAMEEALPDVPGSRLDCVVDVLNRMAADMADADQGDHLDLGLLGYPLEGHDDRVGSMWSGDGDGSAIKSVARRLRVVKGPALPGPDGAAGAALRHAARLVAEWRSGNPDPIVSPTIIHVVPLEREEAAGIAEAARTLRDDAGALLFHCCFDRDCPGNIVVPAPGSVPPGAACQWYNASSEMPELVYELGQFLATGAVPPRFHSMAEDLAARHGLPRALGALGADLVSAALRGGVRVPTGRPGWSLGVEARVEGLRVDSRRGFALIKGMVGFRVFTRLFN